MTIANWERLTDIQRAQILFLRPDLKPKTDWKLKGCPRCRGDMNLDDDAYCCLQCGFLDDGSEILPRVHRQINR